VGRAALLVSIADQAGLNKSIPLELLATYLFQDAANTD
jgi:hypothetical protein